MIQEDITLELLIRTGNPDAVNSFANSQGFDEATKEEKVSEAGIYSAIQAMREEAGGGIDSRVNVPFLSQDRFTRYFSTTSNVALLNNLVGVLQEGTQAMMEAYAQITAIDILGIDSVTDALRRNLDGEGLRENVTRLVRSGYALVFCPHDIGGEAVAQYFPIVDKWRDLVDPNEIAAKAVRDFSEMEGIFEYDYNQEFVYAALDKLVELTDRETVSKLMFERFGDYDDYQRFIDDGKIDAYESSVKPEGSGSAALDKAVAAYEKTLFPSSLDVKKLDEAGGESHREHLGRKMGDWFGQRKSQHFLEIVGYEEGKLYDAETAREAIGETIVAAAEQEDFVMLEFALELPETLIDTANPAMKGFAEAYKFSREAKLSQL